MPARDSSGPQIKAVYVFRNQGIGASGQGAVAESGVDKSNGRVPFVAASEASLPEVWKGALMSTLKELKEKYSLGEGAKHEPNPDCKFCAGTGEKPLKRKRRDIVTGEELPDTHTFCICLFVEHETSNEIGQMLGEFASKELEKLSD